MSMLTIWMWHWYYQCIYGCVCSPPALHALRVLGQPLRVSCPGSPVRSVSETHSVCFQHLLEPEPCGFQKGLERREGGVPTAVSAGRPWRGWPVSSYALYILLYKVKQPKRRKVFSYTTVCRQRNSSGRWAWGEKAAGKQNQPSCPPAQLLGLSPRGSLWVGSPGARLLPATWAHVVALWQLRENTELEESDSEPESEGPVNINTLY